MLTLRSLHAVVQPVVWLGFRAHFEGIRYEEGSIARRHSHGRRRCRAQFNLDYYPWQDGLFSPSLVARDGKVMIPDGPGWGVELSQSWLDAADYRISALE